LTLVPVVPCRPETVNPGERRLGDGREDCTHGVVAGAKRAVDRKP